MKPLRAHDVMTIDAPAPNYRALRRILYGFIVSGMICLGVCVTLIARDARPLKKPSLPAPAPGISGNWKGTAALLGRGICDLKMEIEDAKAYSSFSCTQADPLMQKPHHPDLKAEVIMRLNPDAAILDGKPDKGALRFQAARLIGNDINGCSVSEFRVTRFGARQIAAEWTDCGGGAVIMERAK